MELQPNILDEESFEGRQRKSSEGNEGVVTYVDLTESMASLKYSPKIFHRVTRRKE